MPSIVRRSDNSSGDHSKSTYCLSQLRVTFMLELPQEPQIIFIKKPDVIDRITNHRDPFDAKSERPARPGFRIVADILKHLRMDHAAAGDLKPFFAHLSR